LCHLHVGELFDDPSHREIRNLELSSSFMGLDDKEPKLEGVLIE
jgi:hypothetical protein